MRSGLPGFLLMAFLFMQPSAKLFADEADIGENENEPGVLSTLRTLVEVRNNLREEIKLKNAEFKNSLTDAEKAQITKETERLSNDLTNIENNFEQIATGLNTGSLRDDNEPEGKVNLLDDLGSLLEPVIKEMKHVTADIRQKTRLRDEIELYMDKSLNAAGAADNLSKLISHVKDKGLKEQLLQLQEKWERKHKQALSNHRAAQLQLETMLEESEKQSMLSSMQSYLKRFFQQRGLYLLLGLLATLSVFLFSRLFYKFVLRKLAGVRSSVRSFRQRLIELIYRVLTALMAIIAPMTVFYLAEDWVLFSLGILLIFGLAWTLKYTIPKLWLQMLLMLNVGPVREGERIVINDLPWRVKHMNVYTLLDNPTADLRMRIPIEELVGKISRPVAKGEPWFPCRKSDWVILSDGVRGKVVGLSHEMVELVQRGGAKITYQMADFLGLSPLNISHSFRLKEVIGISYNLQKESTNIILQKLREHVHEQIFKEGYGEDLLNLLVEFQSAGASSLDLVVIADFKGEQAPVYNRIRRSMQRWCVDACTKYGWEIPFTQVVLHQAEV